MEEAFRGGHRELSEEPLRELREWRVVAHNRLRPDVVEIAVEPADGSTCPVHLPGSYFSLHLPVADGLVRCYGLVSAPGEAALVFVVQGLPGGRGSQYLLREVGVGSILRAPNPESLLVTPDWDAAPRTWWLVGGAMGTATLLGLARGLLAPGRQPHRILFLAAHRSLRDVVLLDGLEALAAHDRVTLRHVLSDEVEEAGGGRWTPERLAEEVRSHWGQGIDRKDDVACVAGSPGLCAVVRDAWILLDLPTPRFEDHCAAPPGSPRPVAAITVHQPDAPAWSFLSPGAGRGIWHEAIESGFDAPPPCRGSVCGQCEARLLRGTCQEGLWSQPRGPEGPPIRLCRAHPVSPEVEVLRLR